MSVQIIIDSACDMERREAEARGLIFLPLRTRIDGVDYADGVDITHEEFYEKLKHCRELPVTSQVTPYDFAGAFRAAAEKGDEALAITISSKLSGTYQSAAIAAEEQTKRVWLVDSENVTIGERVLIEYAVQLRDRGMDAAGMVRELDRVKKHICMVALLDTLEYLMKGGRLSRTAAIAGTLLNVKPVIGMRDGVLEVLGKARGARRSNNLLSEVIVKKGGVDFSMPVMLAYSGTDDALLRDYIENSRDLWEGRAEKLLVSTIGSTVGTHSGPGAIAAAFFAKNRV